MSRLHCLILSLGLTFGLALSSCPETEPPEPPGPPDVEHPDPSEATVYLTLPSELGQEELEDLALLLGIDAPVEEQEDGSYTAEASFLGFTGPTTLVVEAGSLTLGQLSSSLSPACRNGIDDDQDGVIDDFDPDCFTIADNDESQPELQERDPEELGGLAGQISEDGGLSIDSIDLPPLTGSLPGGGVLQGEITLLNGSGAVDPLEGGADLDLQLRVAITCTGGDCILPSCTADLSMELDSAADQGLGYSSATGVTTLAGAIVVSDGDCGTDFLQAVGVLDDEPFAQVSLRLAPVVDMATRSLRFDPATGRVQVATTQVEEMAPETPALPTEAEAVEMAWAIADTLQLDIPAPDEIVQFYSRTVEDSDKPQATSVGVTLVPYLDAALWEGLSLSGHVERGGLEVLFGHEGQVLALLSTWRNVAAFETVPILRRAELVQRVEELLADSEEPWPIDELEFALGYPTGADHHGLAAPRTYLAPDWVVHDATDPDGEHYFSFPASDFRPRIVELNGPGQEADGSVAVPLDVVVEAGTPPYVIEWESDLDGDLGSGDSIEAWLSNGQHVVRARVTDANGAVEERPVVFSVTGSLFDPEDEEGRNYPLGANDYGATVRAYVRTGPGGNRQIAPLVKVWTPNGKKAAHHWWEEWRYVIHVDIDGDIFRLRSGRCVPGVEQIQDDGSWTACRSPQGTTGEGEETKYFAEIDRANYVQAGPTPGGGKLVVQNMPGTVVLRAPWKSGDYYAGSLVRLPPYGNVEVTRPGLKTPVTWRYYPPDGGIPCQEIVDFCQSNDGDDPVSGERWCDIPPERYDPEHPDYDEANDICCEGDEKYDAVDADMRLTSVLEPGGGVHGAYATFLEDPAWAGAGGPPPPTVARSDGAFGACLQRGIEPGRTFCQVNPMRLEQSTQVVNNGNIDGLWDNIHLKRRGPWDVVFPFGNYHSSRIAQLNLQRTPLLGLAPWDEAPTIHYHQDWWGGLVSYDVGGGRTVTWYVTRAAGGESQTTNSAVPARFADGEVIFLGDSTESFSTYPFGTGPGTGTPFGNRSTRALRLWITSESNRATCGGNTAACRDFGAPFFYSPAGIHP